MSINSQNSKRGFTQQEYNTRFFFFAVHCIHCFVLGLRRSIFIESNSKSLTQGVWLSIERHSLTPDMEQTDVID